MNNDLNIEDFFKNSFEGHSVEPRTMVWKGISKKLWMRQIGDFFKISFEGYKVNPSTNLWNSIARRIWFYNFLRFNPASFNIYYLGLAVSVITGIIISSDINNKAISSIDKSIIVNKILKNDKQITTSNNKENTINGTSSTIAENSSEIKNSTREIPANKNNENQNIFPVKNNINNQIVRKTNKINPPATTTFFKNQDLNTKDDSYNQKLKAFNTETENLNNSDQKQSSVINEQKMLLSMLQYKSSLLPVSKVSDILFPDTLGYNFFGAPIVIERVHWSVDAWWSPIYNRTLFDTKFPELIEYTGLLKNASSDDITYSSYGSDLIYFRKNWIFQLGVSFTELGQKMRVPNTLTDIRNNSYYDYFENKIVLHDTIWFLDIDALLQGDTVWIAKPVETWEMQKDSSLVSKYDTLKTTNHHSVSNRYTYLEIPIMAGYEIRRNKFSFSLKGGIAAGFFIRSTGSIPAPNGYESVSLKSSELPYVKPNFTILFSMGINYHLNNKIAVFGEPYLRKNINSIFENRYIYSQKFQSVGVKFGVKYTFK